MYGLQREREFESHDPWIEIATRVTKVQLSLALGLMAPIGVAGILRITGKNSAKSKKVISNLETSS